MKGSPLTELTLILFAGLLLVLPLRWLTRPPAAVALEATEEVGVAEVSAWLDLRFSHPPEQAAVHQGDRELWRGGGKLREEADVRLRTGAAAPPLRVELRWSDSVKQAYLEIRLEPDQLPERRWGRWGRGGEDYRWQWEEDR